MAVHYILRLRPAGAWRIAPDSGARERAEPMFHSDAVYSAVSSAMNELGFAEEWFADTAEASLQAPAVRFSSWFPFQRDVLFAVPPRSLWPPAIPAATSPKLRYKAARFVPVSVIQQLLREETIDEERFRIDPESECLIPLEKNSHVAGNPFRVAQRPSAAVDRLIPGHIEVHSSACLEFSPDAGMWAMCAFEDENAEEKWRPRVAGAFRLLADSGVGGERSRGWGRFAHPEWERRNPFEAPEIPEGSEIAYWLLSLFVAASEEQIDWTRGAYTTVQRAGRIESRSTSGALKPTTRMIAEGSVVLAPSRPRGRVLNIAPEGFAHPVFRSGVALSIPIPWRTPV